MFLFNRRFGAEAAADIFLHPPHPAFGIGKHPVGFQNLQLFLVAPFGGGKHLVHAHAQLFHSLGQALQLPMGIIGHGVGDNHARFVQPDMALRGALLPGGAPDHHRLLMTCGQRSPFPNKGAQLCHLRQNHGDNFQGINLVSRVFPGVLGLHHKHA